MDQSSANFTVAATHAQVADTNRQMWARANQANTQTGISQGAESVRIASEARARKQEIWGGASTAIPYAGTGVLNPLFGNVAVGNRTRNLNRANNEFSTNTIQNETATANTVQKSQFTYQSDMETATKAQLDGNVSAIIAGPATAAGGANRGAAVSKAGIDKAYSLEVQAIQPQFGSTTTAACQIKDANVTPPLLPQIPTILTADT